MPTENRKPQTANRLFRIITFGCKVNQVDTAGLSQALAHQGWLTAPPGATPDLHLVNTCTVTKRADQQARQAIRRLSREFPGVPIWVTGCYAQRAPEELAALPGVTVVLGNREKALPEIINDLLGNHPIDPASPSFPLPFEGGGSGWGWRRLPGQAARTPFTPGGSDLFPVIPGPGSRSRRAAAIIAATVSSPGCAGPGAVGRLKRWSRPCRD